MVPAELMAEFRLKASTEARRTSLGGLLITGVIWFGLLVVASVWFGHHIAEWTSGAPPA
jgi:hypothetical protein